MSDCRADAYQASLLMPEKIDEMLDSRSRDYLIGRAEANLGMRVTTGMHHRLSLGPAQRFASKGGWIARFVAPDASSLTADTDSIVPWPYLRGSTTRPSSA